MKYLRGAAALFRAILGFPVMLFREFAKFNYAQELQNVAMAGSNDIGSSVGIWRKQTLEAEVVLACPNCGAGGLYHDIPDVNPGCYDPERVGQPVGPRCPNCGAERPANVQKGQIWAKEFR